jgi:hypothetical protein
MSVWMQFALAALATWRVTHLLANEDGPGDLIVRFRALFGHGVAGKMMDCFNCLSLWVAAPLAFLVTQKPLDLLLLWLALSGAACLLERLGYDPAIIRSAGQEIEGDVSDGMLRPEASVAQEPPGTNQTVGTGQRR